MCTLSIYVFDHSSNGVAVFHHLLPLACNSLSNRENADLLGFLTAAATLGKTLKSVSASPVFSVLHCTVAKISNDAFARCFNSALSRSSVCAIIRRTAALTAAHVQPSKMARDNNALMSVCASSISAVCQSSPSPRACLMYLFIHLRREVRQDRRRAAAVVLSPPPPPSRRPFPPRVWTIAGSPLRPPFGA